MLNITNHQRDAKPQWDIISHLSDWLSSIINNYQVLARVWRKGNPSALLEGVQIGAATVKSSVEIPRNINNGCTFWPSDPTSGNISKGTQNANSKEHKHPYVHCSVIYNCQDMEAAQVSISRWVGKTTMGHLHNGILLGLKKILPFVIIWMNL